MAMIPDGLVFTYEVDHKGVNLTATQQELVMCKHCLYLEEIPAKESKKYYLARYRCVRTGEITDKEDYCSRAEKFPRED